MANGGYFSQQQWQRMEMPLLAVDSIISEFAESNGLEVRRNHKNWPGRSMVWKNNNVRCLIQLYLASEDSLTFNLWLCASQDRGRERYWKQESPVKNRPIPEFSEKLSLLLEEGREKLLEWSNDPSLMEYATGIGL